MFGLFASATTKKKKQAEYTPIGNFTRFSHREANVLTGGTAERLTRFEPAAAPKRSAEIHRIPSPSERAAPTPAPKPQDSPTATAARETAPELKVVRETPVQTPDENDDQIPLWVFQKALPQRYAETDLAEEKLALG